MSWKPYENEKLKRGSIVKAGVYSNRLIAVEVTAPDSRGKWWAWDDINRMEVLVDESIIEYIFDGTESEYEEERLLILENRYERHKKNNKKHYREVVRPRRKAVTEKNRENLVNIWFVKNRSQNA